MPSLPIAAARGQSSIWRPTCTLASPGRIGTDPAGPSTLSNAGAYYFEDRADLAQLDAINWDAVQTNRWAGNGISRSVKEGKQAEFLIERSFPWELVTRIGVRSQ